LLAQINAGIANGSLNPDRIFRKYDQNKNDRLELKEFRVFVKEVSENDQISNQLLETLFYKLDTNGDSTISVSEFKGRVTGQES
jgi:Ca2+-binding EF-hand superfamily protein